MRVFHVTRSGQTMWTSAILAICALAIVGTLWPRDALATGLTTDHSARAAVPTAFLYRPYYGSATVLSRAASLFDHDKPWYASDGTFVRYDGKVFTGPSSATSCQPYVSCYDGHNGYDLNLLFEPVLSAAAGTVIRAGWYNPSNHSDGFGLWVAIDHGNGYYTAYGHLSSVQVTIGEQVGAQWQIATSGTTGSATGPHLHFSVFTANQWQPTDPFGWQSTGTDPNVVPDYYLWVSNPVAGTQAPCLGCTGTAAYQNATIVTTTSPGFSTVGNWQSATGPGMVSGSMRWTNTTTASTGTATATWNPTITQAGYYEAGVYIDPVNASSQWVPYTITTVTATGAAQVATVYVDQEHVGIFPGPFGTINTGPRWIGLGTYYFPAGTYGKVSVTNATGEQGQQLGADAIEFVPVPGFTPATGATPGPPNIVPPSKHKP